MMHTTHRSGSGSGSGSAPKRVLVTLWVIIASSALISFSRAASAAQDASVMVDTGKGPVTLPFPPSTTIPSSTQVDLVTSANSTFAWTGTNGPTLFMVECELVNGQDPTQNTEPVECDNQTDPGFQFTPKHDGSFDVQELTGRAPTVWALPGQFPTSTIKCSDTDACVWFVTENKTDFTQPHLFSGPFFVGAGAPTSSSTTTAAPPTAVATAPPGSGVPRGPSALANTGADPRPILVIGLFLAGVGSYARRRLLRPS